MTTIQSRVSRRGFLAGSAAIATVGLAWPRWAAAQTSCLRPNNNNPTNHWAKLTAAQTPAAVAEVAKLGEAIMLRSRNPYFKNSGGPTFGTDSVVQASAGWPERVQKDFSGPQWSFQGRSFTVEKAIRIPYVVRDLDDNCVEETLLVGFQRLPRSGPNLMPWDLGDTEPAATQNLVLLGRTITTLCKPREAADAALRNQNWNDTGKIDDDGVNKWEFRDRLTRVEKVLRILYGVKDGTEQLRAFLYVGYEGGGGY